MEEFVDVLKRHINKIFEMIEISRRLLGKNTVSEVATVSALQQNIDIITISLE